MNEKKHYTVKINQTVCADESADVKFRLTSKCLPNGEAVFADAFCAAGFDADNAVCIDLGLSGEIIGTATVNHSPFWCRPVFVKSFEEIPDRTQALLTDNGDGSFTYIVPLVGDVFKSVLRGTEDGLTVRIYSGMPGITEMKAHPAFIKLTGSDPTELTRTAADEISRLLPFCKLRKDRKMPPVFEKLGWCSWDALHIFINREELLEKAAEFKAKQIPVGYAILDDMWADCTLIDVYPRSLECSESMIPTMHKAKMRDFEGDPRRFPKGMADAVSALKSAGIPQVGIWFPTTGYWSGLEPDGALAKAFEGRLVRGAGDRLIISPEPDAADSWFDTLCGRVKSWGGDFVKIDNQGFHRYYSGIAPIGKSSASIQQAIDRAAFGYFDGALINCMGMPNECMFNRPSSAVCRCSDDFQPENAEWFTKNILQCSFNGLLQGRFFVNDWDMWWTDDGQAGKNSLCRAISGGPVYLSDKTGRTVASVLKPVCLKDGRLLRCEESATPTPDCLFGSPAVSGRPFKIRNTLKGCGLVACFNLDAENRTVSGTVSAEDALIYGEDCVCREFFSGRTVLLRAGESIDVSLSGNSDFTLYTFYPVRGRDVVPLGRLDLFTGCGAVETEREDGIDVIEGGLIGFWCEKPVKITSAGHPVEAHTDGRLTTALLPADMLRIEYGAY